MAATLRRENATKQKFQRIHGDRRMSKQTERSWIWRTAILAFIAVFAIWEVLTRSVGANITEAPPDATSSTQEEPEKSRAWAEGTLRQDPLNARALGVLGRLAESNGDEALTSRLMLAASRRSLRESTAIYWLLRQSYAREDFASTARYADILMRVQPGTASAVIPALARMAEDKRGQAEIQRLLDSNPPWRPQFFAALANNIADARTPLQLLLKLKDTQAPPTNIELKSYMDFLIGNKFYELAYYTWLQFLPPEQLSEIGELFNASFESAPSGFPFDWTIRQGSGVTIDIATWPDRVDKRALFVEFGYGRVEFQPVTQFIMLAPGAYRFKGAYTGEVIGRRGLVWRLACADRPSAPIGQSSPALGTERSWKQFEFGFTVPEKDCRAQIASLALDARSASEQLVTGAIWFGDLGISRAERKQAIGQ